jgi:hypothetical protein
MAPLCTVRRRTKLYRVPVSDGSPVVWKRDTSNGEAILAEESNAPRPDLIKTAVVDSDSESRPALLLHAIYASTKYPDNVWLNAVCNTLGSVN